ncbi:MAG: Clp protease ClpP, partial [Clostridia bacterium]|nr:Clp protease ClpP [Clostridia bacterium]
MPKVLNNLNRRFYAMATFDDDSAEITLYGDVVETVPTDFWTGKPLDGNFIVQSEFISDLDDVIGSGVKKLLFRINSFGGDASVGLLIHNRLRDLADSGVEITCRVDGVAMSAGSVIMCAANNVIVHPSSLVMIHKCWALVFGGYNADELRSMASANDAWDESMIEIYTKKTGLSKTVISHMMSDTTYMT